MGLVRVPLREKYSVEECSGGTEKSFIAISSRPRKPVDSFGKVRRVGAGR